MSANVTTPTIRNTYPVPAGTEYMRNVRVVVFIPPEMLFANYQIYIPANEYGKTVKALVACGYEYAGEVQVIGGLAAQKWLHPQSEYYLRELYLCAEDKLDAVAAGMTTKYKPID